MTTLSKRMNGLSIAHFFLTAIICSVIFTACTKHHDFNNNARPAGFHSSEVLDKWMTLQLRLMRNATGIPNQAFSRPFVYAGISALQSIAPGLPAQPKWSGNWNGLTGLPTIKHSTHYYYPANVNAAMAAINKALFPNASNFDKSAIDSLESTLNQEFLQTESQLTINTSADFGKSVANAVFNWAETDGYKNANNAYTAPIGEGLWKPTPPALANPASPYWGKNRTVIKGSINNTQPGSPLGYSSIPGSAFFQMVKQVYDASLNPSADQKAMAMFWRDVPGVTSPGHWLSILQQTIRQTKAPLDKAAFAYALTGAAVNDALISCWQTKYHYNLVRPITYIREVMGYDSWNSFLTTPAHPEYSSAHAVLSMAAAETMESIFGNIGSFTDHTYDYMGFAARTYSSFEAIGMEAGQSRLYAGIHYQPSIDVGIVQGKKVAENILSIHPASNAVSK